MEGSSPTPSSELDSSFDTVDSNTSRDDADYAHSFEEARDQSAALMNNTAQEAVEPILMQNVAAAAAEDDIAVPCLPPFNTSVSVTETVAVAQAEPAAEACDCEPTFEDQLENIVSSRSIIYHCE